MKTLLLTFCILFFAASSSAQIYYLYFVGGMNYDTTVLSWRTTLETANDHFVISCGQTRLDSIPGSGTTREPHSYEYRLVQPDRFFEYSLMAVDSNGMSWPAERSAAVIPAPMHVLSCNAVPEESLRVHMTWNAIVHDHFQWNFWIQQIDLVTHQVRHTSYEPEYSEDSLCVFEIVDTNCTAGSEYRYEIRTEVVIDLDDFLYLVAGDTVTIPFLNITRDIPAIAGVYISVFPNPFNPTTTIAFTLRIAGFTTLKVYDILGREVATLSRGRLEAGEHNLNFNGSALPSGLYFARLNSGAFTSTQKLLLLK
jgi:hypothetical protein